MLSTKFSVQMTPDQYLKDANGNVIETITVEEPILQTSPGSKEPLIHEWDRANMQAVVLLLTCIIDPDAYGLKDTNIMTVNWNRLIIKFTPKDISIQLVAEDRFSSMTWTLTFETNSEFSDMHLEFTARKIAAVDAGATISDAITKNCLIAIVSRNTDLKSITLGLPISATLDEAWNTLESRWNFERAEMMKQQDTEMKVKVMQVAAQGANKTLGSKFSKRLPAGLNLSTDLSTNPSHGPEGRGHKTGNCWAIGSANITNKPPTWQQKKSKEVLPAAAASVTASPAAVLAPSDSNVGTNSVYCPEVFIFSASAPLLGAHLTDSDSRTLAERINMPLLTEHLHMDMPALKYEDSGNHPQLLMQIGPVASIDLDGSSDPRYITEFYTEQSHLAGLEMMMILNTA
ncbi:hypothetical protein C8J56DRAFT_905048 [Mycena floridula]|nr:hypothetical protein C8J56DRAFT_905048 [Mycena floridula]